MQSAFYHFDPRLEAKFAEAEELCRPAFARAEEICAHNEAKVLKAFADARVSETHFAGSTGYGYGDRGREVLDEVFARIVGAEDALVRHNFVSGTHALTVALFGVLRTGDRMVSLVGAPYDTLHEVIGLRGSGNGSLRDYGIRYDQVELLPDGTPDLDAIREAVRGAKVAYIQRSRGYALRPSLTIEKLRELVETVRAVDPSIIVMVDNCYGEFVEPLEPTNIGADLIIGSLIKNPGGGIAKTGGYIAGRRDLVEQCSYRLTCVGLGKEVGCTLGETRNMLMGLFFSPSVVCSAVKTATFAMCLFGQMGYPVRPAYDEYRADIIGAIELGTPEALVAFCRGIQQGSPVDSFVSPEPWDMPGYENEVVMAAGAFTLGASIELSADGPLRPPYAVYLQGGLTWNTGRLGIQLAAQAMLDAGVLAL